MKVQGILFNKLTMHFFQGGIELRKMGICWPQLLKQMLCYFYHMKQSTLCRSFSTLYYLFKKKNK